MVQSRYFYKFISAKMHIAMALIVVGLTTLLHFFVIHIVLPAGGGYMSLYVPSKNGGKDYLIDAGEFTIASYIILAVSIIGAIAVALLLRAQKKLQATIALLWMVVIAMTYVAIYGTNAVHDLWGHPWSSIVFAVVALITLSIEVPLIGSMTRTMNK